MWHKTFISIFITIFILKIATAVSICGDNGAVYFNDNICNQFCSVCSKATLKTDGASGSCDTLKYQGFVFFNNKTYAMTKNTGFWTDFQNLAMPKTKEINDVLTTIVSYYNKTAWIGLYDPNQTQSFNSVDKTRFIWLDGTSLTYDNFANGEPNNALLTEDIGVVPIYGEHWVHMYSNGKWNDNGYHKQYGGDYKPKFNALVEWDGPLDCVNAYMADNGITQDNLSSNLCNGQTPCYACTTDGVNFRTCDDAKNKNNQKSYSCPINRTACTATYENPTCPQGGNFNANTGKCEAQPL